MRQITKDIQFIIDVCLVRFRLTKLDAFSGVMLLRLLMRLEAKNTSPTILNLISSFSEDDLRSVMTAVLNHVSVLLPVGPHPVMTSSDWGYPELEHDTPSSMKLLLESIAWSLSVFLETGSRRLRRPRLRLHPRNLPEHRRVPASGRRFLETARTLGRNLYS